MMKIFKIFFWLIIMIFSFTTLAHSLEFAVGSKVWFVTWDPWWKDAVASPFHASANLKQDFSLPPTVMGGLSLSLVEGDLGLNGGFGYGGFGNGSYKNIYQDPTQNNKGYQENGQFSAARWDFDFSASYRIISGFKIFAGAKGQHYDLAGSRMFGILTNSSYVVDAQNSPHEFDAIGNLWGPGIGVGYTTETSKILFGATLSYAYLTGSYKMNSFTTFGSGGPASDYGFNLTSMTYNAEPFIGFHASENALFMLGFRFQYITTKVESFKPNNPSYTIGVDSNGNPVYSENRNDIFYGADLTYSIMF